MKLFKNQPLKKYLDQLASRQPAPGGGSAAALVGALGAGLISMVANYSIGKGKSKQAEKKIKALLIKSERLRAGLFELVDLDAQAYLNVVKTRKADLMTRQKALKKAREIPLKVSRLCYQAVGLTPDLVKFGNPYLLSDVKVAIEFLQAAFQSAMFNVEVNQ